MRDNTIHRTSGAGTVQRIISIITLSVVACFLGGCATSVEELNYTLVSKTEDFELRDYPPHIVAETVVAVRFNIPHHL